VRLPAPLLRTPVFEGKGLTPLVCRNGFCVEDTGRNACGGTAVLDIVSPCVTFNNHEGSTKSVAYARSHEEPLHEMDFIPHYEDITVEYEEGETTVVTMHDGSRVTLTKLGLDHNSHDRNKALRLLDEAKEHNLFYTGLVYYSRDRDGLDDHLNVVDEPLAELPESRVRPSLDTFNTIMDSFK